MREELKKKNNGMHLIFALKSEVQLIDDYCLLTSHNNLLQNVLFLSVKYPTRKMRKQ